VKEAGGGTPSMYRLVRMKIDHAKDAVGVPRDTAKFVMF
jgi:hypothetical protein